ncbi:MAG: hypothetical protein IPJ66_18525 [Bacteroidetes bacterium]|nr:hypothetical protein [Bacteroidota bacterium]MBL0064221.1 hypothetical protein [Bacteroidota bacterium]MBL0139397.1 hypothetical protein [Bacteroidota bacterium]
MAYILTKTNGKFTIFSGCKCGGKIKNYGKSVCNSFTPSVPMKKPDLAIYSQLEEIQNGRVPSWDSPDISTNDWGPFKLKREATFIVRNLSDVPAINALAHFYTSPYGIGTKRELKSSMRFSIGARSKIELLFPLHQTTLRGEQRLGVHLELEHPFDSNRINNYGAQVHDGAYTTESGKDFIFSFPVINDFHSNRDIQLSILPTDLITTIDQGLIRTYSPFEQITVSIHIRIPEYMVGTSENLLYKSISIIGRSSNGDLIGGVTRLVWINN